MKFSIAFLLTVLPSWTTTTTGFAPVVSFSRSRFAVASTRSSRLYSSQDQFGDDSAPSDVEVEADATATSTATLKEQPVVAIDPQASRLKEEFLALASASKRGFSATSADRQKAKDLVDELATYNPTGEPASPYYVVDESKEGGAAAAAPTGPTLAGKWTLVYTDAPDITTLDGGPLATAKLGRIGQECAPPLINNVIEWRRPDWAANLPFSGTEESRVLQKVCVEGVADPQKPLVVNLKIVGLDLLGMGGQTPPITNNLQDAIQADGLLAGILENNPIEIRGPLSGQVPFGQFEILYLDSDMRIIRTGQGFLAANVRDEEEWF